MPPCAHACCAAINATVTAATSTRRLRCMRPDPSVPGAPRRGAQSVHARGTPTIEPCGDPYLRRSARSHSAAMNPFRNLVVGIDLANAERLAADAPLAPASRTARDRAVAVARRSGGALHLLTALDLDPYAEEIVLRGSGGTSILERAKGHLAVAAEPARAAGVAATTEVALGRPVETLLADVQRNRRDLVVVGTRERSSLARNLLGSTALSLLRRAPAPVWVARRSPHETEKRSEERRV